MSNSVLHLALSHSPLLLQASQSNHGVPRLLQFLLALCMALHSVAQNDTTANRAPPPVDPYPYGQKFNPSMAIIMVVLVSAFFLLGFFSVYLRQCADGRYRGGPDRDRDPSAPYGFGRLSRAARGLDASVIDTFPTFLYSSVKGLKIGKGSLECAVCLNEFDDNETLRLIPKCSHVFHPDCIDAWLCSHTTCPVCRADLVPKPGEDDHPPSVHLPDSGPRPDYIDPVEQVQDHLAGGAEPGAAGSRPIRTRSTGMRLGRLFVFPRSHSTGHSLSLVRPGDDHERFTLRLPEEVWSQMISDARLNRANSCVPFPRASSLRTGYRSRRGGSGRFGARGQSPFFYERFDRDSPSNRWVLSKSPPFILRAGSARVGKGVVDGGGGEVGRSPTMGLEKPSKPPQFDRWDLEVGERSSDKLRPGYRQV